MFRKIRLSGMICLGCLLSNAPMAVATTTQNTEAKASMTPLQLAYNGAFVNIANSNDDDDTENYKIKRGKAKGAKLIEHSLSLIIKDLKRADGDKEKQAIWQKANPEQKLVFYVYEFRKSMAKGGFQAYFRSEGGSHMRQLKKALIALKANQYLLVLNKAIKAFADDPHVLDDTFGRNGVLDQMDEFERFSFFEEVDAEYRSLEDDELLVDRVSKYLNEHAQQFFAKAE